MKKSILIADDDHDVVELLCRRCEAYGLCVDSATNAMSALGKAEELLPDVVLMDVDMPYGNGLSVCEMMADHAELAQIPVIVMTGAASEETVRRCHQLCAYYVPKGPELWSRIEPLLEELVGPATEAADQTQAPSLLPPIVVDPVLAATLPPPPPPRTSLIDAAFEMLNVGNPPDDYPHCLAAADQRPWILSIEDDEDVSHSLALRLGDLGFDVHRAAAGREGYRQAFFETPSAIILDYELPEGNGDYVLRRLKESPATAAIPVVVLTGRREPVVQHQMRRLGADEFLHKPFDWEELRAAVLRHAPVAVGV